MRNTAKPTVVFCAVRRNARNKRLHQTWTIVSNYFGFFKFSRTTELTVSCYVKVAIATVSAFAMMFAVQI